MNTEDERVLFKWQSVINKNGKRANEESPCLNKQRKQAMIHRNRFDILSDDDNDELETGENSNMEANEATVSNIPKPPPLIIPGVVNISEMISSISKVISKKGFSYKSSKDGQIRLLINNIDSYRKIVKLLEAGKISYHTYQPKQERSYRIVLKGLHHSTPIEDIKNEITLLGHEVRNVFNVKSRVTKQPLSMFFIDLEPRKNNKEIYELKHLNNANIKVEPPRQTSDMVQCYRCQEFGHTKTYCRKPYKCVKCGLLHPTSECTKPKDTLPTCVHCQQHHTANYRGCIVYQQLTGKKPIVTNRMKESVNLNTQNTNNNTNTASKNKRTYASVLTGKDYNNEENKDNNNEQKSMENIERLLSKQIELTNTLLNMMSLLIDKLCKQT